MARTANFVPEDRHVRYCFETCYGGDVDKMTESLRPKLRQRCRDAVQHAFDVDVDHLLPILDAQVVERGDRHHTGVIDEHIKLAVPLAGQPHERR
jgi:hypothetical protein